MARETTSYIKAVCLSDFPGFVKSLGGDPLALLDKANIPQAALNDPEMLIGFSSTCRLLELAAEDLGRPDFSVAYAQYSAPSFTNLGPLALLANFTSTMQQWLETGIKYWSLHTNGFTCVLLPSAKKGLMAFRYNADSFVLPARQTAEHCFSCVVLLARIGTNSPNENPRLVRFQHAAPADTSAHKALFGCPIEWGAEHNEIIFEERLLALPTPGYLTMLRPLMDRYVRSRIDRMKGYDQSATTMVALAIPTIMGSGKCSAENVASALGTNLRTMQRQLADEGTSFTAILDRVRRNLATNYLRETEIAISRIAEILEYASTAAFTNAFQRWEGEAPLRFRKLHRGQG